MASFCHDGNWQKIWSNGDFSECFEDGLLAIGPLLYILLFGSNYLVYLRSQQANFYQEDILLEKMVHTCSHYGRVGPTSRSGTNYLSAATLDGRTRVPFPRIQRSASDILIIAISAILTVAPLVSLALHGTLSFWHLYPYQIMLSSCVCLSWAYCTLLLVLKSAPKRGLPHPLSLRVFWLLTLALSSIKLRTRIKWALDTHHWDANLTLTTTFFSLFFIANVLGWLFKGGPDYVWPLPQQHKQKSESNHRGNTPQRGSLSSLAAPLLRSRTETKEKEKDKELGFAGGEPSTREVGRPSIKGPRIGNNVLSYRPISSGGPTEDETYYILKGHEEKCRVCMGLPFEAPELNVGLAGWLLFWWMNATMRRGYNHTLTFEDLDLLPPKDEADNVFDKFRENARPKILRTIFAAHWGIMLKTAVLKLMYDMLIFVGPQMLNSVIKFLQSPGTTPTYYGVLYAMALCGAAFAQSLLLHQYFHLCFRLGMHVRIGLTTAIYSKAMCLSGAGRAAQGSGEVVNLMSTDTPRIQDSFSYMHILWSSPLQMAIAIYFLWLQLGGSVFLGVVVMLVLSLPLNAVLAGLAQKYNRAMMEIKDERVKIVSETLTSIKIIKLYAWEQSFLQKIIGIRGRELVQLRKYLNMDIISSLLWNGLPIFVALATFACYVLLGNTLTTDRAFTALALFEMLRFPMIALPGVISYLVEARVSAKRIQNFLDRPEIEDCKAEAIDADEYGPGLLVLENGFYFWDDEKTKYALRNIQLGIQPGALVVVVGETGSGKTALLSALIGDLPPANHPKPTLIIKGSVAYTSQVAWIRNATVRDNILFGKPLEQPLYNQVVEACGLTPDLEILPAGDQTEIGARGINLSGGQKQRVALARAAYQMSDVYLLDDPLSAVDAHVARHILDYLFLGLLKDRTRILVTHNVEVLPRADLVIVMEKGAVQAAGRHEELLQSGMDFQKYLKNKQADEEPKEKEKGKEEKVKEEEKVRVPSPLPDIKKRDGSPEVSTRATVSEKRRSRGMSGLEEFDDSAGESEAQDGRSASVSKKGSRHEAPVISSKKAGRLIDDEERATGAVSFEVYKNYFKACGGWRVVFTTLFFMGMSTAANIATSRWLAYWSTAGPKNHPSGWYLGWYAALAVSSIIFIFLALISTLLGGFRAATKLHTDLLVGVLRAPMHVFDTTPVGRLLNRFSKDLSTVDESLPHSFESWLECCFDVVGVVVVVCYVIPWFLIAVLPIAIFYRYTQNYYLATTRELKRWDSTLRSPIFSHFAETIEGAASVRAFGVQLDFIRENHVMIDRSTKAFYPSLGANRWLALRLESVATTIVTLTTLFVVLRRGHIDSGLGALAISYTLSVTQSLNYLVRATSERETNIVSVERIKEYSELPIEGQEDPLAEPGSSVPPAWPSKGEISLKNIKLRYRDDLPLVLKGITCVIQPRDKIGVVGRTGAGKSSVLLGLLRLVELAEGSIKIDGVDISMITLNDLRSRLSIIPQDPVLFSGTVRFNLDPFSKSPDAKLWEALRHSHLETHVRTLEGGLLAEVAEGGSNFSLGQRQLLCLARALLRNSKILLLDEATSAIDVHTDHLVQKTIREAFADCTTLTIAHRVNTIMNSTKVMVLDGGLLVEFGSPKSLLANRQSAFSSILAASTMDTPRRGNPQDPGGASLPPTSDSFISFDPSVTEPASALQPSSHLQASSHIQPSSHLQPTVLPSSPPGDN